MQTLIGLRLPESPYVCPLRDWSIAVLMDAVLSHPVTTRQDLLSKQLLVDPSLLAWTVACHPPMRAWATLKAASLANWLAPRLLDLLADHSTRMRIDEKQAKALDELQQRSINAGRRAQQLAQEHDCDQAHASYFCAALSFAEEWLMVNEAEAPDSNEARLAALPSWLQLVLKDIRKGSPPTYSHLGHVRDAVAEFGAVSNASQWSPISELDEAAKQTACSPRLEKRESCRSSLVSEAEIIIWRTQFPIVQTLLSKLVHRSLDERRARELHAQTAEREKIAAMQQVAYGASHEINNPLANIATRAQSLLRDESDPQRRRQLATINYQAFRAHEMIADMMLFAKPPKLECKPFDLRPFVTQTVESICNDHDILGSHVRVLGSIPELEITADPVQLDVVIRAIVKNAFEATAGLGEIEISVRANCVELPGCSNDHEDLIEFEIKDNGPGISPEVRRHLFDPFYSGREAGRGLGFGLPKAWRIIELHRGQIVVSSEAGMGTTFSIHLPRRFGSVGL